MPPLSLFRPSPRSGFNFYWVSEEGRGGQLAGVRLGPPSAHMITPKQSSSATLSDQHRVSALHVRTVTAACPASSPF